MPTKRRRNSAPPAPPRARATLPPPADPVFARDAARVLDVVIRADALPRMLGTVPRDPSLAVGLARIGAHAAALDRTVAAFRTRSTGIGTSPVASVADVLVALSDLAASAILAIASAPVHARAGSR